MDLKKEDWEYVGGSQDHPSGLGIHWEDSQDSAYTCTCGCDLLKWKDIKKN